MLVGIGVIGALTSSITTYFVREDSMDADDQKDQKLDEIIKELNDIEKQNKELKSEIEKLKNKS